MELRAKVVGLRYHKVNNPVKNGETVYIQADFDNEFDGNAISVKNEFGELLGHIAKKLSPQNIKNGARSNIQLYFDLPKLDNRRFKGVVDKAFKSCLYIYINTDDFEVINKENTNETVIEELKKEIECLKIELGLLKSRIHDLESQNPVDKVPEDYPSSERMLYSVVGLSHFDGQDNLDGELTIVEEPIYPNAKGTALYLKVGDRRLGVFPSERKREYCEQHKIPFYENQKLKKMNLNGEIRLEELLYDEYAIISI